MSNMNEPQEQHGKVWQETTDAAYEMGLSSAQLLKLRSQLRAGHHWRCKNPTAAPGGRRYLFHMRRLEHWMSDQAKRLDE